MTLSDSEVLNAPFDKVINEMHSGEWLRTHWIPMLDATSMIVAVAWKNDESRAWALFEQPPEGRC